MVAGIICGEDDIKDHNVRHSLMHQFLKAHDARLFGNTIMRKVGLIVHCAADREGSFIDTLPKPPGSRL